MFRFFNLFIFQGRLGNQMFQFTHAIDCMKREPLRFPMFFLSESIKPWHGPNLFDVFEIKGYRVISSEKSNIINSPLIKPHIGYYQSFDMVEKNREAVLKRFSFKTDKLNVYTQRLLDEIKKCQSIAIHVRRTDYVSIPEFNTYGLDYYYDSVKYIESFCGSCNTFVFSDDIDWCRQNINLANITFVNGNSGDDYWQDMYIMTQCNHNVIANSTFSWWGAYLNRHKDKIVIAPRKWTTNGDPTGILPSTWIKI